MGSERLEQEAVGTRDARSLGRVPVRGVVAVFLSLAILVGVLAVIGPEGHPEDPRRPDDPTASPSSEAAPPDLLPRPSPDVVPKDPAESSTETAPGSDAVAVRGRVLEEDGTPIPHATVRLMDADTDVPHPLAGEVRSGGEMAGRVRGFPVAVVLADAEGRFEIPIIATMAPLVREFPDDAGPGTTERPAVAVTGEGFRPAHFDGVSPSYLAAREICLDAWAPGFTVSRTAPLTLDPEKTRTIDLVLPTGRVIRGTVVDHDGVPIEGLEVRARRGASVALARSSSEGRFLLEGLVDGMHTLDLPTREWSFDSSTPIAVEGEDAGTLVVLVPGTLTVEVVDAESGLPIPEAIVFVRRMFQDHRARDGGYPNFPLGHPVELTAGSWIVTASAPSTEEVSGSVHVERDEPTSITLSLVRTSEIHGRVVDPEGRVLAGATIGLARLDEEDRGTTRAIISRRDGGFDAEQLHAGRYRIVVRHPDMLDLHPPPFDLRAGEPLDLGTLTLRPGARLAGRLSLDRGGAPAWAEVTVEMCDDPDAPCEKAQVRPSIDLDRERWSVNGLPEGRARVVVRYRPDEIVDGGGETLEWASAVMSLEPGTPLDLDIFLPRH